MEGPEPEPHPHDVEAVDEQAAEQHEARKLKATWEDDIVQLLGDEVFRRFYFRLTYGVCQLKSLDVILNRQLADEAKGKRDLAQQLDNVAYSKHRRAWHAMFEENDPEGGEGE